MPARSLVPILNDLADLSRQVRAPYWSARLVVVAKGDEWERAVTFDALCAIR